MEGSSDPQTLLRGKRGKSAPWTSFYRNRALEILSEIKQFMASLAVQMVKNLPAMWESWVQSLGWEDILEKEMAPRSSILAWKIPWTEEPGRL